jgi:hypothetical protein
MRYGILFALMLTTSASAQEKSLLERDPKGWTDLTPGKDLLGWKRVLLPPDTKLNDKNPWKLEDGLLVCDGVGVKEMLLYDKEFSDGVFHVEWRFRPAEDKIGYNGGIYVRSLMDGKSWLQAQVAVLDKPPFVGDLFADVPVDGKPQRVIKTGSGAKHMKAIGEWNTMEVSAQGKKIEVSLNGRKVTKWNDYPVLRGHVGLQAEFYYVEYRNLKFKVSGER